jgi:hypothetical protein
MPNADLLSEPFPKGSTEHIIVDLNDRLGNLTSLATAGTKYDVRVKNAVTYLQQGLIATVIGMRAYCLIDTTLIGYVPGRYELFFYFQNLPEAPRLGPVEFLVNA